MLIAAPLAMMLATAPSADAVGAGRKAFSACLEAQIEPSLKTKPTLADFTALLKAKCGDKEAAFRTAILAADKADGMSLKDSQSDADDQVTEYVDKITAEYEDYAKSP
ncbi:hypothetical protein WG907_03855 [Sphingobium sp. AN558]|uniref:hypothetical protein n=1 Tax=Sphingobium sp. AN558 TaxID=3133442 RepID=UPI0030C54952